MTKWMVLFLCVFDAVLGLPLETNFRNAIDTKFPDREKSEKSVILTHVFSLLCLKYTALIKSDRIHVSGRCCALLYESHVREKVQAVICEKRLSWDVCVVIWKRNYCNTLEKYT